MRFRIRKAKNIPKDTRVVFERVGAPVVGAVLGGGLTPGPGAPQQLRAVYNNPGVGNYAADWLTEQHDIAERKESWLLIMEIAITTLVFMEVVSSLLNFSGIHDFHELRRAVFGR